jgi:hypothetical protein
MSGTIPPPPQYAFMAWCLFKHGDNFILLTILPSMPSTFVWSVPFRLTNQKFYMNFSSLPFVLYAQPFHLPWFDYPNIWWSVQFTKLFTVQSSPTSYRFLPLRYKYSPQHLVLQHPHCSSWILPLVWQTKFRTHAKYGLTLLFRLGALWRCGDGLFF